MKKKKFDIVALGELLIDFTPTEKNEEDIIVFERNPGGAPANVLAMATKLGNTAAFIGKVGNDDFGIYLGKILKKCNIADTGLIYSKTEKTTLAFVHFDATGDRSFTFYRNPGADIMLSKTEIKKELIDQCAIFHFGSVSMTNEPSRSATVFAATYAQQKDKIVSFDPNYRAPLWDNSKTAKASILSVLPLVDILKISEEKLFLLTEKEDLHLGSTSLAQYGPSIVLVTLGSKGAYFYTSTESGLIPTYNVTTIDTTGAGDAFFGAVLSQISKKSKSELKNISLAEWKTIVDFANAAGSLTTAKKGAIPALPTYEEIKTCQASCPKLISH